MGAISSTKCLRAALCAVLLGAPFAAGGCSAKTTAPAESPGGADQKSFQADTEVTSAEGAPDQEFAEAEAQLDQLFGGAKPGQAAGDADEPRPLSGGEGDRCELACKALGSMVRAADRVCDLEPDGDRCGNVRERTDRARDRVRSACPSCSS